MANNSSTEILTKEEDFHDRWARNFDPATVLVDQSFAVASCPENCFIAQKLGNIYGKRVLELGTGLGEAAIYFAKQGAEVTATDISGGMLQLTQKVAELHQVSLETFQMDAAQLNFPDNSFDIVYGANVLHHVDTAQCLREVWRVLKPGGQAAFWDPLRYNPVINAYRNMASQVRSEDEHPLGRKDVQFMKDLFSEVQISYFWLMTLAIFLRFYFIDQVHPNEERYWKKVIYDYDRIAGLYKWLYFLDRLLLKLPGISWWAWNIAVVLTK